MNTTAQIDIPPVRIGDQILLTKADDTEHLAQVLSCNKIQGVYVVTASSPAGLVACTVCEAQIATPIDLSTAIAMASRIVNGHEPRGPISNQAMTLAVALLGVLGGAADAA